MAVDLTQRPPRSPRVRIGSYALLARILDKCRATLAGRNGEYTFNCPLDQRFFSHFGVDAEAFKQQVQSGKGDGEMLAWVSANAKNPRTEPEIVAWSAWQEQRVPGDVETRAFFHQLHEKAAPKREDVGTWFEMLDLDDYVSFGGQP